MGCLLSISNKILVLLIATSMFCSCRSTKNYDYKYIECQEIPIEAINIAITDYSNRLRKRKDIDNITAVEVFIVYTSTDWFYIATKPWLPSIDESGKYHLTDDKFSIEMFDKYLGQVPPSWMPTQYVEKDNVLYVWHDPQAELTENLKNALVKYDLFYDPEDEMIITTDGGDISYIFCKTNYKRKYYRRVKAPYNTPLPSCGCH